MTGPHYNRVTERPNRITAVTHFVLARRFSHDSARLADPVGCWIAEVGAVHAVCRDFHICEGKHIAGDILCSPIGEPLGAIVLLPDKCTYEKSVSGQYFCNDFRRFAGRSGDQDPTLHPTYSFVRCRGMAPITGICPYLLNTYVLLILPREK